MEAISSICNLRICYTVVKGTYITWPMYKTCKYKWKDPPIKIYPWQNV